MIMMTKMMTKLCKIQPKKVMLVTYMTTHKMLKLKKGEKWSGAAFGCVLRTTPKKIPKKVMPVTYMTKHKVLKLKKGVK